MTFLHKLAKRLARIPAAATLLLLGSCSAGAERDFLGPDPSSYFVSLSLSPRDPQVAVGDSVRFEATGRLGNGQAAPIQVIWSASGGSISSTGWFRPATAGDFVVRVVAATETRLADSVRVTAFPRGGILKLQVSPAATAVPRGASQQFTALASMVDGSTTTPTVSWSATGGSITPEGLFTATGPVGSASVSASLGAGQASSQATVWIQPPLLTQLVLNPSVVSMEAGETRQLTLAASWTDGSSAVPAVAWSVEGGTLSAQNVYTAGTRAGSYRIIASNASFAKADTAVIRILPPVLGIRVEPASATLAPGATQAMSAFAVRSDGSETPAGSLTAGVQWTATGGALAPNGIYTAGTTSGQYLVIVNLQGLGGRAFSDTANLAIAGGTEGIAEISVTPHDVAVPIGGKVQFEGSASLSDGSTVVPAVNWTAEAGSIDATGLFSAPMQTGTFKVVGKQRGGTRADTAFVSVGPKLVAFRVTPDVDTLVPGQQKQFSSQITWSNGATYPATVQWSSTGGVISQTGMYTSGTLVGSFLVVAACSCGAADTAAVTVRNPGGPSSPTLMSLALSPHAVALALGGIQQFSPTGTWSDGTTGPVGVLYEVSCGNISAIGYYVAPDAPGTCKVIATQQGGSKADTAVVTVGSGAVLNQVVLNPASVSVVPGGTQQFSAAGVWSDGSSSAPSLTYQATGGTVAANGLYTAGSTAGTYRVIATQAGGTLADTSAVTISGTGPTLTSLVMTPATASVAPGTTRQFSVSASWSDGSSSLPPLSFSATGGTVSGGGVYTAGTVAGTYKVIVRHVGGTKADTSAITVPSLSALSLSPKPASVGAGGTLLFSVTGTWSDGSSAVPQVSFSATGGTVSPAGLYTAGSTQGTYRVIAKHSFGTRADTSAVTIGAAIVPPPSLGGPGDLVVFPSPEVAVIIGPQIKSGSASSPWPWFDQNQVAKGIQFGTAFPAIPGAEPIDHDMYLNRNYYDLGLALYTAYYRTGNSTLLTLARKVTDSWWQDPMIGQGTTSIDNSGSPRGISLGGLMLRALDGRPEMWPWIESFVRQQYQVWLGARLTVPQLYYGVRDGGYMLLYSAWLAQVDPNAAVRAEFTQKALDAATQYYARLQSPDGGWYWLDPAAGSGEEAEPFMVGLLLDGMIATHLLTQNATVAQSIVKAVDWMYNIAYETKFTTNLPTVRWRAMKYFVQKADPTGSVRTTAALYGMQDGAIRDARQLNPLSLNAFGYAYKLTGDSKYRLWGDEVFSATFGKGQGPGADAYWNLADFREKEYNASYRSSGRYLVWRLGY